MKPCSRRRASLAHDVPVELQALGHEAGELPHGQVHPRDPRLPPVGTVIRRAQKGEVHDITVLDDGFEYEGRHFTSLSALAREITGTNWNGFVWAGLSKRKAQRGGA